MRICTNCNTGNKENALYCTDCGVSLAQAAIGYSDYLAIKVKKEEKIFKIKKIIHIGLFLPLGIIFMVLLVL